MKSKALSPIRDSKDDFVFQTTPFEYVRIRVILDTVEHQSTNAVGSTFDLAATITDGVNPKGEFDLTEVNIPSGNTRSIDETIFTGIYGGVCGSPSGIEINFKFDAETEVLGGIFNDSAHIGYSDGNKVFIIPVVLDSPTNTISTIIFRGRIVVGCT